MTELMGEAAEMVYWSLSALIQSHGAEERGNTRKNDVEFDVKERER